MAARRYIVISCAGFLPSIIPELYNPDYLVGINVALEARLAKRKTRTNRYVSRDDLSTML
jgi:hypothetical protein